RGNAVPVTNSWLKSGLAHRGDREWNKYGPKNHTWSTRAPSKSSASHGQPAVANVPERSTSRGRFISLWQELLAGALQKPLHGLRGFGAAAQQAGGQHGRRAGQGANGYVGAVQGLHLRGNGET